MIILKNKELHEARLKRWRKKFKDRFGYDIDNNLGIDWWDMHDSDLQEMYNDMKDEEFNNKFGS